MESSDAKRCASVGSAIAEYINQEFRGAIGDQMLVCKSRSTVDQNLHFDDPPDEVEVTDGRVQRADEVDGHTSGGLFPLFDCEIRSKLSFPGLPVLLGDVAGHKHEAPNARKWHERRYRLRQSRQLDLQTLQCLVYRQTVFLK